MKNLSCILLGVFTTFISFTSSALITRDPTPPPGYAVISVTRDPYPTNPICNDQSKPFPTQCFYFQMEPVRDGLQICDWSMPEGYVIASMAENSSLCGGYSGVVRRTMQISIPKPGWTYCDQAVPKDYVITGIESDSWSCGSTPTSIHRKYTIDAPKDKLFICNSTPPDGYKFTYTQNSAGRCGSNVSENHQISPIQPSVPQYMTPALLAPANNMVLTTPYYPAPSQGRPCFEWSHAQQNLVNFYNVTVSTTPDFATSRWQMQVFNSSARSVCWNNGSGWVAKGTNPPSAPPLKLSKGVTYYWRVIASYNDGTLAGMNTAPNSFVIQSE